MLTIVYTACIMIPNSNEGLQPELDVSGLQRMLLTPSWATLLPTFLDYYKPHAPLWNKKRFIGPATQPTFTHCISTSTDGAIIDEYISEVLTHRIYKIGKVVTPISVGYSQVVDNYGLPTTEVFSIDCSCSDSQLARLNLYRSREENRVRIDSYFGNGRQDRYLIDLESGKLKGAVIDKKHLEERNRVDFFEQVEEISRLYDDVFSFKPLPIEEN